MVLGTWDQYNAFATQYTYNSASTQSCIAVSLSVSLKSLNIRKNTFFFTLLQNSYIFHPKIKTFLSSHNNIPKIKVTIILELSIKKEPTNNNNNYIWGQPFSIFTKIITRKHQQNKTKQNLRYQSVFHFYAGQMVVQSVRC